jgi:hypothetical protein
MATSDGRLSISVRDSPLREFLGTKRIWMYSDVMGVRIKSPFATIEETAKILGVSPRRAEQLEKLIDGARAISARTRDGIKKASAEFKLKKSASRSARNESPNRPQTRRGTQKRAKKAKAAR